MNGPYRTISFSLLASVFCSAASAQWVEFVDETSTRLVASPGVGANDDQERDYSWGDLNNNGWVDLVAMRKSPFTTSGLRRNVLFMNENGVLVDRSAEYASASTVEGDMGFLTPTNDRDSVVVDIDDNGWKDIVTATTLSDGHPKYVSHPRVYKNQGLDQVTKQWIGFVHEEPRIPQLAGFVQSGPHAGMPHAPRFCAVDAGDLTGDGMPDLFFGDYDTGGSQTLDFGDRLLVNDGTGFFADESFRVTNSSWLNTVFTTRVIIEDFNQNGVNDIIRINSLSGTLPYQVHKFYNNPNNEGTFGSMVSIVGSSPYYAERGDLNNNGLLDLVVARDGNDVVLRNLGNQSNGQVNWSSGTNLPSSNGFRSNIRIADLDNDGYLDIMIATLDVDINNCNSAGAGRMYRNNANPPAVTFTMNYGNLTSSVFQRAFDFALIDINGNGWIDVVVATGCQNTGGTKVLMNQPQFGIDVTYPDGNPMMVPADSSSELLIDLAAFGGDLDVSSVEFFVAVGDGKFEPAPISQVDGSVFAATLPATECGSHIQYYVSAALENGFQVTDPAGAPANAYVAISAVDFVLTFEDDIDGDVSGWTIENTPGLTTGGWEQANPVGAFCCGNVLANPDGDSSADGSGMAFVTQNCEPGQPAGQCQVAGGVTTLVTAVIDLSGADAMISYDRWFFSSQAGDPTRETILVTEISSDGGKTWELVHETNGTNHQWQTVSFLVSDVVTPTSQVQLRFVVDDTDNDAVTNAGIDNLVIEEFVCDEEPTPECPADLTGDGQVDVFDLLVLLGDWGACEDCAADLNGDGIVDVFDLLILLGDWGTCP